MRRRALLLAWPAAIGLGVAAESVAFSWDDPRHLLPDLAVGLAFVGCGLVAWERERRGVGVLLAATGVCWFAGNFGAAALYLHRGPLVHLIVAYAGLRPRSRLDVAAVAAGYVAAGVAPAWRSETAAIVLAVALLAVAARGAASSVGRIRRERLSALKAATALALVLAGGAAARLAVPAGDAADPALLAYQAVLCAVAVGLAGLLAPAGAPAVTDLVVELGEARAGTLRDRLARALGDPSLELGYWSAGARAFLDDAGRPLVLPEPGGLRSATVVERDGERFAVLLHDRAVLEDPALVEAVASATRLSESNAALREEVRAQVAELTASRRRLLVAADEERQRLEARLHEGAGRRLAALGEALSGAAAADRGSAAEHVARASAQLAATVDDLHELARGLHPRELTEAGLRGALVSLAGRAPVSVALDVRTERLPAEVEATVYFLCAEALANVAKYACATRAEIEIAERDGRLVVAIADDGVGGADAARGTGLQGLADRVEALGGTLRVVSPRGAGTRLAAELPLP